MNRILKLFTATSILVTLFVSCSNDSSLIKVEELNFKEVVKVEPDTLLNNITLNEFANMIVIDSLLIVNSYNREYVIHVFDKRNGSFINNFLKIGNGPGEFISSGFRISKIGKMLYVYSPSVNLMRRYYFPKLLNNSIPEEEVSFKEDSRITVPIKNNYIASTYYKERFLLYDHLGKRLSKYDSFPRFFNDDDSSDLRTFYLNYQLINVKPDQTKFCSTTLAGSLIQVFKINNGAIELVKQKGFEPPIISKSKEKRGFADKECILGFRHIQVTDEYIYVLYCGTKVKDLNKNKNIVSSNIYVFDWNCKPIKKYEIKDGRATCFCIDEQDQKIFLYSILEDGEATLSYFKL